jgi:hypothetical protein
MRLHESFMRKNIPALWKTRKYLLEQWFTGSQFSLNVLGYFIKCPRAFHWMS